MKSENRGQSPINFAQAPDLVTCLAVNWALTPVFLQC